MPSSSMRRKFLGIVSIVFLAPVILVGCGSGGNSGLSSTITQSGTGTGTGGTGTGTVQYAYKASFALQSNSALSSSTTLGIAIDGSDNIYVTDGNEGVEKFDAAGSFIAALDPKGIHSFSSLNAIAIDPGNNIYVSDTELWAVKTDSEGNYISTFGNNSGNGTVKNPQAVAIDASGDVYISDCQNEVTFYGANPISGHPISRIVKLDPIGNYIGEIVGSGDKAFDATNGLAVDSNGDLYVSNYSVDCIEKFDSNGNYLSQFGSSGTGNGQFHSPEGIAVDSAGNIYVVDTGNARIEKFNAKGQYLTQFGATGAMPLAVVEGIAVDHSGNVYVTDASAAHIVKFSAVM